MCNSTAYQNILEPGNIQLCQKEDIHIETDDQEIRQKGSLHIMLIS